MNNAKRIRLPDGTNIARRYEKALVMESNYRIRYEELLMNHTREGMVLVYIISEMNEDGVLICDFETIASAIDYSRSSVIRAVKLLKEQYSDLVTVGKFHNISKFTVDPAKCFKA